MPILKKPVIPSQNRHSTFRREKLEGTKRDLAIGRYIKLLPEKKPRNFKKMKAPLEMYKDETIRKAIKHLMDLYAGKIEKGTNNGNVTRKELWFSFCDLQKELSYRNINIFNNTGQDLHLLLPLSGMSSVGYFYKAIFERLLPKARVTFLKTYSRRTNDANHFDLIELKKSINKNDNLFVMIDYYLEKK